jgi:hypothetical protein
MVIDREADAFCSVAGRLLVTGCGRWKTTMIPFSKPLKTP